MRWIWRAWHTLTHDRPWIGGGFSRPFPGRIPWSVIDRYAERNEISGDDFDMLVSCVAAMDSEYLRFEAARGKE